MTYIIDDFYLQDSHSDATIICQGKYFPAHKLVLCSCSKYFEEIFEKAQCKHPFIIINDLDPTEFEALMKYMYRGEVNVTQDRLPALIKAAEALNIKGLAIPDDDIQSSQIDEANMHKVKLLENNSKNIKSQALPSDSFKLKEEFHHDSNNWLQETSKTITPANLEDYIKVDPNRNNSQCSKEVLLDTPICFEEESKVGGF